MSLAELISQHQNTGSSIKARTNRFWSYIGNNRTCPPPPRRKGLRVASDVPLQLACGVRDQLSKLRPL
ncbi:hypothetical protein LTR74_011905 [Friedmanniomyces endolithicus]|nr:hypothetical protein LTR74_011905 [Friedmanniomyces endolithicus]